MKRELVLIHRPEDTEAAVTLADQLLLPDVQIARAGDLTATTEGRRVLARRMSESDLVIVLWNDAAASDPLLCAQIAFAVKNAVPVLALTEPESTEPAPLGLTAMSTDAPVASLHAAVTEQLDWGVREASHVVLAPAPEPNWRIRAGAGALAAITIAASAWVIRPAAAPSAAPSQGAAPMAVAEVAPAAAEAAPQVAEAAAPAPTADRAPAADTPANADAPANADTPATADTPAEEAAAPVAPVLAAGPAADRGTPEVAPAAAPPAPDLKAALEGVRLPAGNVDQVLAIEGQPYALHRSPHRLRLYQLVGRGPGALARHNTIWLQRRTRTFVSARMAAGELISVDREEKERSDVVRIIRWRRGPTGYWMPARLKKTLIPTQTPVVAEIDLSAPTSRVVLKWLGAEAGARVVSVPPSPALAIADSKDAGAQAPKAPKAAKAPGAAVAKAAEPKQAGPKKATAKQVAAQGTKAAPAKAAAVKPAAPVKAAKTAQGTKAAPVKTAAAKPAAGSAPAAPTAKPTKVAKVAPKAAAKAGAKAAGKPAPRATQPGAAAAPSGKGKVAGRRALTRAAALERRAHRSRAQLGRGVPGAGVTGQLPGW